MKDYILFKNLDHEYLTLTECIEKNGGSLEKEEGSEIKEEDKTVLYYVTDEQQQSQYINMFKNEGLDAVLMTHNIDSAFMTQLEQKNEMIRFQRLDADLTEQFKEEVKEEEKEAFQKKADTLTALFRKALGKEQLAVQVEKMKDSSIASVITLSEQSRRMMEMMKMYGMSDMDPTMFGVDATLNLNSNHALVQYISEH